jgi:hypothetical protein
MWWDNIVRGLAMRVATMPTWGEAAQGAVVVETNAVPDAGF